MLMFFGQLSYSFIAMICTYVIIYLVSFDLLKKSAGEYDLEKIVSTIEKYFNDTFLNIIENGINLKLTPMQTTEILFAYFKNKNMPIDRDTLMTNLADVTLAEIQMLLEKIKSEYLIFIDAQHI